MTFLTLSPYLVTGALIATAVAMLIRGLKRLLSGQTGCNSCSGSSSCIGSGSTPVVPTAGCPSCSSCPSARQCSGRRDK